MRNFYIFLGILLLIPFMLYSQTYKIGYGSVKSGVIINSAAVEAEGPVTIGERIIPHGEYLNENLINIDGRPTVQMNVVNENDLNKSLAVGNPVLLKKFNGIADRSTNIPPDPYIAAGPTRLVGTVNSEFAFYDKDGKELQKFDANTWYRKVVPGTSPFDPKVIYDHYSKRWTMVWLDQDDNTKTSWFHISVSDDSIPEGNWYNWSMPSYFAGSDSTDNWADYQGVGYDDKAIYITSNQFQFGGSYQYVKIRIIPKEELYNHTSTAGEVNYIDLYDITYPAPNLGSRVFNIRPAIMYTPSSDYYLMHIPNPGSTSRNYVVVYKISNPTTNPVLTAVNVPVTSYSSPAKANQLGGSTILLESGGTDLRNEPKFQDGFLYAAHSIRNPEYTSYSSVRFLKINTTTNAVADDQALGAQNFWHFYPAVEVDANGNAALTYSRSGEEEYIGAFFTSKMADESAIRPSRVIAEGKGNYVRDYGSGRNRWGDYTGIWRDPIETNNVYLYTEYALPQSTWGVAGAIMRMVPMPGIHLVKSIDSVNFGNIEISKQSNIITISIANIGEQPWVITSFPKEIGQFKLLNNLTFPLTINSYDTLNLEFQFVPNVAGSVEATFDFVSNVPAFTGIKLKAKGYVINKVAANTFYASTGSAHTGTILTINQQNGTATTLGLSLFNEVRSLAVNPKTNELLGLIAGTTSSQIVRINAALGDAYLYKTIDKPAISSITFDTTGTLYLGSTDKIIYTYDLNSSTLSVVDTTFIGINSLAFDPTTNKLYAAIFLPLGSPKDRIFEIDLATADTNLVGRTMLNLAINAITFDKEGNLYGVSGSNSAINNFFSISKQNGLGSIIGPTGFKHVLGLTIQNQNPAGVVEETDFLPGTFSLKQNYPNPFNPSTIIEYSLPINAEVRLSIFNVLGEEIAQLLNTNQNAGSYKVNFNANGQLTSGIYFYKITVKAVDGSFFTKTNKMILMK